MARDVPNTKKKNEYNRFQDNRVIFIDNYGSNNWKKKPSSKFVTVASCFLISLFSAATFVAVYHSLHRGGNAPGSSLLMKYVMIEDLVRPNSSRAAPPKIVSCYYNLPSESGPRQLMPADIHPNLCTHINIAFARVVNNEIKLENYQYETLLDIVKLKHKNPDLKILLSVGGAKNDNGFPDMVLDHKSRKTFIRSIKYLLRNYTLDGIDLDWEFPALHGKQVGGRERQHFSQLLREIRMEYTREKKNYLLTIAAAAPQTIVDVSYDVDQLNLYLDFVNVMTYDFHYYTKFTPFTGFNSPLYRRGAEQLYLATLNINYTVQMYRNRGLDLSKIVVGIPTYGHTFSLVNANNHHVSSPASGFGSLGSSGFINYPDVCTFVTNASNVTIVKDNEAKVPYLYRDKEWISYEGPQSVMEKAKFIIEHELGGAMIYSLNADDYEGICRGEMASPGARDFPLSLTVFIISVKYATLVTRGTRERALAHARPLAAGAARGRRRRTALLLVHTEPHAPHTLYF